MRDISFGGKRVDNGEWVYGGYYKDYCYGNTLGEKTYITVWNTFGLGFIENVQVVPETVGQFTGLYAGVFNSLCGDKEYDEIYEGDKISVTYATQGMSNSHEHTITGVVKFQNGSFVVEWDFPKKGKYKYQTLNSIKRLGDCGVTIKLIGNIHDQKEDV